MLNVGVFFQIYPFEQFRLEFLVVEPGFPNVNKKNCLLVSITREFLVCFINDLYKLLVKSVFIRRSSFKRSPTCRSLPLAGCIPGPPDHLWTGTATGFGKVLVVATDDRALDKVERQLAGAGLIIPARIEVGLRDGFWKAA